jgi:hypothetical protein
MKVSDMRKILEKLPDDLDIAVGIEDELYDIASAEEGEYTEDDSSKTLPVLVLIVQDEDEGDEEGDEEGDDENLAS